MLDGLYDLQQVIQINDLFLGLLPSLSKNGAASTETQTLGSLAHTQTRGEQSYFCRCFALMARSSSFSWTGAVKPRSSLAATSPTPHDDP
jgi:hypothetical protein